MKHQSRSPQPGGVVTGLLALAVGVFTFPVFAQIAFAQTTVPEPDLNGNYWRNQAVRLGQVASPLSPGFLWRVAALGLNCRSGAGLDYAIVRQFEQGQLLQADVGRGGSDEVLINATDDNGNPWMRVRSPIGESYDCYVRANRRYIQPDAGN
jgi:hypothetical protein